MKIAKSKIGWKVDSYAYLHELHIKPLPCTVPDMYYGNTGPEWKAGFYENCGGEITTRLWPQIEQIKRGGESLCAILYGWSVTQERLVMLTPDAAFVIDTPDDLEELLDECVSYVEGYPGYSKWPSITIRYATLAKTVVSMCEVMPRRPLHLP
jgi:hypothetical protein